MVPSPRNYQSTSPSNSYGGASGYDDDAALAKALQEEYEREYRRRGMRQHLDGLAFDPPIAPSAPYPVNSSRSNNNNNNNNSDVFHEPFYSPNGNSTADFTFGPNEVYHDIEISDETYALQLEQQMVEEAVQRQLRSQERGATRKAPSRSNSTDSQRLPLPPTTTSNTGTRGRSISTRDHSIHQQRSASRDKSLTRPPSRSHSRNPPSRNPSQHSLNNTSERSRRSRSNPRSQPPSRSNSRNWNANSMPTAVVVSPNDMSDFQVLSDEELAKRLEMEEVQARIEQEDRDNELARQYLVEDQIRRAAVMESQRATRPKKKCATCRRCFSCILILVVIAAGVYAALYFTGNSSAVGDFGLPDPQQFREEDPFNNANPADANLWRTQGSGLELTVVNALEDHWVEFFTTAVAQWDSGTPDALTLTVEVEEPQSVCSAQNGVLKVCNGNYGNTNWRGINKVLLENGWIYSSAARMNEYYLTRDYDKDFAQMSYTMCHEIGHGFGLPHTDENFFNKDLGNCMDYSQNPEVNMQPDTPNFDFLAQLYGTVDGSPVPAPTAESGQTETTASTEASGFGGGRHLSRLRPATRPVPDSVVEAFDSVDQLLDSGTGLMAWPDGGSCTKLSTVNPTK